MRRSSVFSSLLIVPMCLPITVLAQTNIDNCQKIDEPGSYVVTRNLPYSGGGLLASGNCLKVTVVPDPFGDSNAASVSIDLAGHTITGDGEDNRAGISATSGLQHIRVTGGNIVNFYDGIDLGQNEDVTVHGMRLLNNFNTGIKVGNRSVVTDNVVSNDDVPESLGIKAGVGSRVTGNLVSNTVSRGISVKEESTVSGNNVRLTVEFVGDAIGIRVLCPSRVTDNSVTQTTAITPGSPQDIKLITPAAGPPWEYNFGHCFHLNNAGNVIADNDPGPPSGGGGGPQ